MIDCSPGSSSATRMRINRLRAIEAQCAAPETEAAAQSARAQAGPAAGRAPAHLDRTFRKVAQVLGKQSATHDRIAPIVELDDLRQELGAHAEPFAADAVDLQGRSHGSALHRPCGVGAAPALVPAELVAEDAQAARQQGGGTVGVMARAPTADL